MKEIEKRKDKHKNERLFSRYSFHQFFSFKKVPQFGFQVSFIRLLGQCPSSNEDRTAIEIAEAML
jgi:hypothetical protein